MSRPLEKDYAPFYSGYVNSVTGDDIIKTLTDQILSISDLFNSIPEEKGNYFYAEGKWSIKELLGHLNDAERVFAYRAMCIARGEKKSLPGFDENEFVKNARFNDKKLADLLEEHKFMRYSNIMLFNSFSEEEMNRRGLANNLEITVRALLFITAGHEAHHIKILKERYLENL